MKNGKLVKVTGSCAVYLTAQGRIFNEPIDAEARTVLHWYYKNIPAND